MKFRADVNLFVFASVIIYVWLFAGAIKASTEILDLVLATVLYIAVVASIYYYLEKEKWLLAVTSATFFLAYVLPASAILGGDPYQSMYLGTSLSKLAAGIALVTGYFVTLVAVEHLLSRLSPAVVDSRRQTGSGVTNVNLLLGICFGIAIGGTMLFGASLVIEDFSRRTIEGAGNGPWLIFGYLGYLCVGLMCWRLRLSRPALMLDLPLVLLAGWFFLLLGWRGSVLYPLVIYLAYRLPQARVPLISSLLVLCGASLLYEIDILSGSIRSVYASRGSFNLVESLLLHTQLRGDVVLPMSFSHLDLLTSLISQPVLADAEVGRALTILPSLLNWIPRALSPEKALTTGPILAIAFFPDVLADAWRHTSSLTTGPIVEMYYNFGTLGVFLGAAFHGWAVWVLTRVFSRHADNLVHGTLWPIVVWLVGFSLFFDDLGGFINKAVLIGIGTLLMALISGALYGAFRHSRT